MRRILKSLKSLKGESLIEVLIAFAIFSAIAISAIGAIRSSLYRVQGSLEDTMARTEIDTQAEALRFIQDAYMADPANEFYASLWNKISSLANKIDDSVPDKENAYKELTGNIQFDYGSHSDPYDPNSAQGIYRLNGFVINIRLIGSETRYQSITDPNEKAAIIDSIVIPARTETGTLNPLFTTASTFPRLIYDGDNTDLLQSEGIWIVAVQSETEDFLDFYIRTCWDVPGSSAPDKISTTIRLASPDKVAAADPINRNGVKLIYHYRNKSSWDNESGPYCLEGSRCSEKITVIDGIEYNAAHTAIKVPILDAPYRGSIHIPSYTTLAGWAIGDSVPTKIENWSNDGLYCPNDGNYYPSCQYNEIEIPLASYKPNQEIHLYAIIKPQMYIQLITDTSGSMGDEINSVSYILSKLLGEATRIGGYAEIYTLGDSGFGQFSTPNCNSIYGKSYFFSSSSGTTADFENKFKDVVKNISYTYSDAPEYCGTGFINYRLQTGSYSGYKKMIIYLTDTYGVSYRFVNGHETTAWNSAYNYGRPVANGVNYSTLNATAKSASANIYVITQPSQYSANLSNLWGTATSGTGNTYTYSYVSGKTLTFTPDGELLLK